MKNKIIGIICLQLLSAMAFSQPTTKVPVKKTPSAQSSPQTLNGRWVGTYGNEEKEAPYYFSFAFKTDSTLITYSAYNKVNGHGKYKLIKNKLSLTYRVDNDVQQYECIGIYNDSTRVLTGTWRRISDVGTKYTYTQSGKWVMQPVGY